MTENVKDATHQILMRIQDDLSALREDVSALRKGMQDGFARSDEQHRKTRRDIAGLLVMAKSTAVDFDQRIRSIEDRVTALETRRS
jgi:hypothetical protein